MEDKIIDYKIVTNQNVSGLTHTIKELIKEGWEPIGSHSVVEISRQNMFNGLQHKATKINVEYSQTLVKKTSDNEMEEFKLGYNI